MIDWLTFKVEVAVHDIFQNGSICKFGSDGSTEWVSPSRFEVAGSYEASVTVRSLDGNLIELSGNFIKHFQGHNLWGSNDVMNLSLYSALYITGLLGLEFERIVSFSRVDISGVIYLGSQAAVSEFVRYLGQAATVLHRGRGSLVGDGTVYFGQRSRRWSLKIYNKQKEALSTKSAYDVEKVAAVAEGLLRVEVTLRGLELKRLCLSDFYGWDDINVPMMLREFLDKLQTPEQRPRLEFKGMPRSSQAIFIQWAQGDDIRAAVSRPTFYRHRKLILAAMSVDIGVPPLEPITHISELAARYGSVKHFPRLSEMPFWEPSESDRAALPTFDPVEALNSSMGLDRA